MSDKYDVAGRLAEGHGAVEHIETYVRACQTLGYQQPELTAHRSQVQEWYGTEAGLDLRVLDGDAAGLSAAVTAIDEALWMQRTQVTELAAAWRGAGAESAARFLQRHCDAAEEVAAHVRAAAQHYATLRDDVWQAVDGKVATTVAIDERRAAERPTWLAAAQAVTAGAGDPSAAEVVVHQQVMPFVDNDIRNDWLAAISSANASVAGSYDTAIHALASTRDVRFDIPGDLGPRWQPYVDDGPVVAGPPTTSPPTSPTPTVPAAAPAQQPTPEAPQRLSAAEPAVTPSEPAAALGDAAGLSAGAGGLGGLGGTTGGIGGVLGSIVDSIGSLLGSLTGGLGGGDGVGDGPAGLEDDRLTDDDQPDEADEANAPIEPAGQGDVDPEPSAVESTSGATEPTPTVGDPPPVEPPADAERADAEPAVAGPPQAAAPTADGSTPCEIAEDQLPQVGQ